MIYIAFLPLALWRHLHYYTLAGAPLIAFLLCGVENIGIMIENPMRIMPMAAYCATIHGNVMYVGGDWAAGNFLRPCVPCVCEWLRCLLLCACAARPARIAVLPLLWHGLCSLRHAVDGRCGCVKHGQHDLVGWCVASACSCQAYALYLGNERVRMRRPRPPALRLPAGVAGSAHAKPRERGAGVAAR